MSVATLPYERDAEAALSTPLQPLQRGRGAVEIRFERRDRRTALAHLYQRTPCRALFPREEPGDPPLAVLLTTSGGLAGGDQLTIGLEAGAGAGACITTQAAEKIYGARGTDDARIRTSLAVGEGGTLEWLPQETILFDGARLDRSLTAEVALTGRLLAGEMLVFGRTARGEVFSAGRLRDRWRISRGGKLIWADRLGLAGDILARLDAPFGFGGARALATAIHVGPHAAELLPLAKALAEKAERGAATLVGGVLVARLLGRHPHEVRAAFAGLLAKLREAALGLPGRLPRAWAT